MTNPIHSLTGLLLQLDDLIPELERQPQIDRAWVRKIAASAQTLADQIARYRSSEEELEEFRARLDAWLEAEHIASVRMSNSDLGIARRR